MEKVDHLASFSIWHYFIFSFGGLGFLFFSFFLFPFFSFFFFFFPLPSTPAILGTLDVPVMELVLFDLVRRRQMAQACRFLARHPGLAINEVLQSVLASQMTLNGDSVADLLLRHPFIDINLAGGPTGNTLFLVACQQRDILCLRRLLSDYRVDINCLDIYGDNALSWAVEHAALDVLHLLLRSRRRLFFPNHGSYAKRGLRSLVLEGGNCAGEVMSLMQAWEKDSLGAITSLSPWGLLFATTQFAVKSVGVEASACVEAVSSGYWHPTADKIKTLSLADTSLTALPPQIENCVALEELNLCGNAIPWRELHLLRKLPALKRLVVGAPREVAAARVFCLVALHSDGYLAILDGADENLLHSEEDDFISITSPTRDDDFVPVNDTKGEMAARFFRITAQLPQELQMVVCLRAQRLAKSYLGAGVFETRLPDVLKMLLAPRPPKYSNNLQDHCPPLGPLCQAAVSAGTVVCSVLALPLIVPFMVWFIFFREETD